MSQPASQLPKPVTDLVIYVFAQLSLQSASGSTVGALPEVVKALVGEAGKASEALGKTDEDKKLASEWIEAAGKGELASEAGLKVRGFEGREGEGADLDRAVA